MKIIKDNYNKEMICSHCKSVFTFNKKDIEHEAYNFTSAYGDWCEVKDLIKCPVCHKYIILKTE